MKVRTVVDVMGWILVLVLFMTALSSCSSSQPTAPSTMTIEEQIRNGTIVDRPPPPPSIDTVIATPAYGN